MAHDPVEASKAQIKSLYESSKAELERMKKAGKSKEEIQAYRDRLAGQLKALRLVQKALRDSQRYRKAGGKPMKVRHKKKP